MILSFRQISISDIANQINWLEGIETSLLFGDSDRDIFPYLNPEQDIITFQNVRILSSSFSRNC
jgi:hypothetical protein